MHVLVEIQQIAIYQSWLVGNRFGQALKGKCSRPCTLVNIADEAVCPVSTLALSRSTSRFGLPIMKKIIHRCGEYKEGAHL